MNRSANWALFWPYFDRARSSAALSHWYRSQDIQRGADNLMADALAHADEAARLMRIEEEFVV